MYEGGESNPHETYFYAHGFLRPAWLPITSPSHLCANIQINIEKNKFFNTFFIDHYIDSCRRLR